MTMNSTLQIPITTDFHAKADATAYYKQQYTEIMNKVIALRNTRTGRNIDAAQCIKWLEGTDFFKAPASSRYHEAYAGGLVEHSLKVAKMCSHLLSVPEFASIPEDSAILCALIHDWCKIGMYESYMRNVKDEKTGTWHQEMNYRRAATRSFPFGHGASSMFLGDRFFRLHEDELLAIRWHMGAWYVCDSETDELQQANENYPLVHLLQFADQLAITNFAKLEPTD